MSKLTAHLKTVHIHRREVRKACWKMGLFWQGLTHDLSKYSLAELKIAKYYVGTRSPHAVARDIIGYSPSWMHHYTHNKHHWQYFLDLEDWPNKVIPVKMPYKYVIEMFCDFIGAGKAYSGDKWNMQMPWDYWEKACEGKRLMHSCSTYLIKKLLWNMHERETEKDFYQWYNSNKDYLKSEYEKGHIDY